MLKPKRLPAVPRAGPYVVNVEVGTEYVWCHCGLSKNQPWCDGSHINTGIEPISFTAPISGEFYMCGCKRSDNKPYCFGNCRGYQKNINKI